MVWMLWVLWAGVLLGGLYGIRSALKASPRYGWVGLTVVAILALGLRVDWRGEHFYGLEYEDAYVYAAASRFVTPTTRAWDANGLAVCAIGSLERCTEWERFPGHLMGLPALLAAVQKWMAFRPALPPLVGAVLSSFAAMAVWWTGWAVYGSFWSAAVGGLLFAATPALALYGGSACSESASSAAVAVAFGAAAMCRRSKDAREWWAWHALVLMAMSLAVLTRRENVVLLLLAPLFFGRTAGTAERRWKLAAVWVVLGVVAALMSFPSLVSEVGEYGSFSFGVGRFIRSLPTVLQALTLPRWFGLIALAAVVGVWRSRAQRTLADHRVDNHVVHVVGAVAIAMLLLYASHVRSAYQLGGARVEPFEYLRYLTNAGAALCILAASAIVGSDQGRSRRQKVFFGVVFALYLGASASASWALRGTMVTMENETRTEPALRAIAVGGASGERLPIATLEPLIVQIYGAPSTEVMSVGVLTPEHVRAARGKIVYLLHDRYQSDVDIRRYAQGYAALPLDGARELQMGNGWRILRLGVMAPTK